MHGHGVRRRYSVCSVSTGKPSANMKLKNKNAYTIFTLQIFCFSMYIIHTKVDMNRAVHPDPFL